MSNKVYAVKIESGSAKLYDANNGSYWRTLCSDVSSAVVLGELVQVTRGNGRVEIYKAESGSYVRSL